MDQWWKKLPLFITFLLFLSNAYGFKGGAYSNAQLSDNTFSPPVQSSVSEVPVYGNLPEEVGSSLFANRPQKSLNLLQFVKGHVSSRPESTSHALTVPSSSVSASLPLPLNEQHAGSLTLLQGSPGSTITDTASVSALGENTSFSAVLGTSGLSTSNQSSPSSSSSWETFGAKSAEATLPVFSQESISYSSSSTPGATYTSQGQSISPQGQSSYSSLSQSQGASSPYIPDSYNKLSSSSVSSQSTSVQSSPSVSLSSPQGAASQSIWKPFISSFGIQTGFPMPVSLQGSTSGGSLQHQGTTSQFAPGSPSSYPSVSISTPQGAASQSATVQSSRKQFTSSFGTQSGFSTPLSLQGSTTYGGSLQHQGTTSPFAPGSPSFYPSVSLSSPQGAASQSSWKQFISSYGIPSGFSTPLSLQGSTSGGSLQHQGTTSQFAPGSPSSYPSVSISTPQVAASQSATVQSSRKQFTSTFTGSSGTQEGPATPFNLQGSTTYGGSLQPQGTTSPFATGSPSSYPSVSISTPQGAASQSSQKQFTSSFGTQSGFSTPLSLQGSTTYGGSLQHQGTTRPFAPGSPSSYPSVSLSSPQGAASQSSWKRFISSFSVPSGFSTPLSLQGSTTYGGSRQHQGTTSPFAPGSPSSYPSVSLSSPQGAASQSSWKQFISSFGIPSGFSTPLSLQGSTTYGGSLQHQDTTSQFAPGSPSSHPSVSLSSPQGFTSQPSQATMQGSFSPLSLAGGSSSGYPGQFASAQGGGSRSYAKLVSLPLAGSDVQLYKVSSNSQANAYTSPQKFSSYGAQFSQAFRAVAL